VSIFQPRSAFRPEGNYQLLPFRVGRLNEHQHVATNEVGEYVLLEEHELQAFVARTLDVEGSTYRVLKARHFLFDQCSRSALDLLAIKYRSRKARLAEFTALHIFVVTLRCDHSCHYCQVSRQEEHQSRFDLSAEHAERALSLVFLSPSPKLKIEFQGGEPLLAFERIRHIVLRAQELNRVAHRDLQFVIASNLSRLSPEILTFCRDQGIQISTSLDGPADLHDRQRPRRGGGSHDATIEGIRLARESLGPDAVSALMTTTRDSLGREVDIIDEYVRQGFHSIFLRPISPYGFAARQSLTRRYREAEWIAFYQRGLSYVIDLNRRGYPLREELAAILLNRILSPLGDGYVDLQSPAGIGIGAIVYNYDGAVYASDEGRMLAEMGDQSFRLGHLDTDSYESMLTGEGFLSVLMDSMPEGVPGCTDCPFVPYCGADPVFHQATHGDPVGHKAFSAFCERQTALLKLLIAILDKDAAARDVLLGWV
jgi:uncharacterized protein